MTQLLKPSEIFNTVVIEVCNVWGITPTELMNKRRFMNKMLAKHAAIFILRKEFEFSLKAIGKCFGGLDHTTIRNSIKQSSDLYETSKMYRKRFDYLNHSLFCTPILDENQLKISFKKPA